jgi:predicted lysophospholipase L1 biosynthesis ABC-type transport system permease subunit
MMHPDYTILLLTLSASLIGGILLGVIYFRAVQMTVDFLVAGARPVLAVALTLGRFALLGGGLFVATQFGAISLGAMLVGILLGRTVTIRWVRGKAT